jgi:hypothetical protein
MCALGLIQGFDVSVGLALSRHCLRICATRPTVRYHGRQRKSCCSAFLYSHDYLIIKELGSGDDPRLRARRWGIWQLCT